MGRQLGGEDGNEGYLRTVRCLVGIGVAGWGCDGGARSKLKLGDGIGIVGEAVLVWLVCHVELQGLEVDKTCMEMSG